MELVGGVLVWSETGYWVCWFWRILGGAVLQTMISHFCVHLEGATKKSVIGCHLTGF